MLLRRVRRRVGEHRVEQELDCRRVFEGGEQRVVAAFAGRHVLAVARRAENLDEQPRRVVVDVAVVLVAQQSDDRLDQLVLVQPLEKMSRTFE